VPAEAAGDVSPDGSVEAGCGMSGKAASRKDCDIVDSVSLQEKVALVLAMESTIPLDAFEFFRAVRGVAGGVLGASDKEVPWTPIKDFDDERHLGAVGDMEVRVIKTQWSPRKHKKTGPDVGGQFQFNVRNKKNKEGAKIIVRQDLPTQEHLNVAVRRLSTLGRVDVGGLLGFDDHPESLERVTAQCNQWRSANHYEIRAMPDMESRSASMPRWKQKWQQVREERRQKAAAAEAGYPSSDATKDNEAGASLHSRDIKDDRDDEFSTMEEKYAEAGLMCACPADPTEYSDGVLTEAMTALFADATWD